MTNEQIIRREVFLVLKELRARMDALECGQCVCPDCRQRKKATARTVKRLASKPGTNLIVFQDRVRS